VPGFADEHYGGIGKLEGVLVACIIVHEFVGSGIVAIAELVVDTGLFVKE
jgi:hypothetical protein